MFTTLMALTFLFMPYAADIDNSNRETMLLITGVVFWGSLLIGYGSWIRAAMLSKKTAKNKSKFKIRIFDSVPRVVADTIFCLSLIWFIWLIAMDKNDYSVYVCISILIVSLNMHGLLGGNLFHTYINKKEREKGKK